MILEDTLKVKAPAQKVWNTLLDIPSLVSCIPGIEKVEAVNETTYNAVLNAKVSFITATFDVVVTVTEKREPTYIEARGEGKGRRGAGRITFSQAVTLKPMSDNETEALYKLEMNVIGGLATVGGKAIARKASEVAEVFSKAFIAKCEGKSAEPPVA